MLGALEVQVGSTQESLLAVGDKASSMNIMQDLGSADSPSA